MVDMGRLALHLADLPEPKTPVGDHKCHNGGYQLCVLAQALKGMFDVLFDSFSTKWIIRLS